MMHCYEQNMSLGELYFRPESLASLEPSEVGVFRGRAARIPPTGKFLHSGEKMMTSAAGAHDRPPLYLLTLRRDLTPLPAAHVLNFALPT